MTKTIRKYDIAEYAKKGTDAIEKMLATQQPGQIQKGSKLDVMLSIKDKIKAAHDAGYTTQQIAAALKDGDVFGILPKMLNEVLGERKKPVARKPKAVKVAATDNAKTTNARTANTAISGNLVVPGSPVPGSAGTFIVKPDTEDL